MAAVPVPVLAAGGMPPPGLGPPMQRLSVMTAAQANFPFDVLTLHKHQGKIVNTFNSKKYLGFVSESSKMLGQTEYQITSESVKQWTQSLRTASKAAWCDIRSPGGDVSLYFDAKYVSDAETAILVAVDTANQWNLANVGAHRHWTHYLIGVVWTGDGVTVPVARQSEEFWMKITQKIKSLDEFALELIVETVTPFWRNKLEASEAFSLRKGRMALGVIDELLIDKTSAYVNDITSKMDVTKNPSLRIFEAEDPTKILEKYEGLYNLLLHTSQGKSGSYNVPWYFSKLLASI